MPHRYGCGILTPAVPPPARRPAPPRAAPAPLRGSAAVAAGAPARRAGRHQRKRPPRRPSPPSSSPHTAPLLAADVLTVYEAAQTGMTRDGAPAPEAPSFGLNFTPPSICSRTFPRSPCPPRSSRSPAPWSWHNCRRCSSHSAPAARPRRRPPAGKAAG